MTVHQQSFDELSRDTAPARHGDPATSQAAAKLPFRRNSQRHLLLTCYGLAWENRDETHFGDLTDEEAATVAGISRGCPWKRCSELREMLMIAPTGHTRTSSLGADQQVCRITEKGRATLDQMGEAKE